MSYHATSYHVPKTNIRWYDQLAAGLLMVYQLGQANAQLSQARFSYHPKHSYHLKLNDRGQGLEFNITLIQSFPW